MKKYLSGEAKINDRDFVSCIDELPLWSAPFGLRLLELVEMKAGLSVLDIGCGLGFPLIELAQRLGNSCRLTGIDPWKEALDRIRMKTLQNEIPNIQLVNCTVESMTFEKGSFDLIVSNNGLNNVQDLELAIKQCGRVAAPGAQFVITQNLEGTMIEFYTLFEKVLSAKQLVREITDLKNHIYQKRRPVYEMVELLEKEEFGINSIDEKSFCMRFLDAEAFFNHSLIKFWFCDSWKNCIKTELQDDIFTALEKELNHLALEKGKLNYQCLM